MRQLPDRSELVIESLGEASRPSPLRGQRDRFVSAADGVLIGRQIGEQRRFLERGDEPPCFEAAGLEIEQLFREDLRRERGRAVPGLLYLARKPSA